jgi:hypothetical protein
VIRIAPTSDNTVVVVTVPTVVATSIVRDESAAAFTFPFGVVTFGATATVAVDRSEDDRSSSTLLAGDIDESDDAIVPARWVSSVDSAEGMFCPHAVKISPTTTSRDIRDMVETYADPSSAS